jgi:hypothetical protein
LRLRLAAAARSPMGVLLQLQRRLDMRGKNGPLVDPCASL